MGVPLVAFASCVTHQPSGFSKCTLLALFNALHNLKAFLPIWVTLAGIVMLAKTQHLSNAESPILVIAPRMVTLCKALQLKNVFASIFWRFGGSVIVVNC